MEITTSSLPLTGLNVLVTRPQHQAAALMEMITQQGGHAELFSTLEIQPIAMQTAQLNTIEHINKFDYAIFASANAVIHTLAHWSQRTFTKLRIVAIGPATAAALRQNNIPIHLTCPAPYSSEILLQQSELKFINKKYIAIFCGENSKPLLAATLTQRSANVTVIPVYRRLIPAPPTPQQLQHWQSLPLHTIISTSYESLKNLYELMVNPAAQHWLKQIPLLVISKQVAEAAVELGFTHPPQIAANASDSALLEALKIWYYDYCTME